MIYQHLQNLRVTRILVQFAGRGGGGRIFCPKKLFIKTFFIFCFVEEKTMLCLHHNSPICVVGYPWDTSKKTKTLYFLQKKKKKNSKLFFIKCFWKQFPPGEFNQHSYTVIDNIMFLSQIIDENCVYLTLK